MLNIERSLGKKWILPVVLLLAAGCSHEVGSHPTGGSSDSAGAAPSAASTGQFSGTFTGLYVDVGEGPIFSECETGHQWRVASGGASKELDQAYLAVRSKPGAAVRVTVEAHSTPGSRGVDRQIVVDKVAMVSGESACPGQQADASLTGTTWHLFAVGVQTLDENQAPVTMRLDKETESIHVYTLCRSLAGTFSWIGTQLTFGAFDSQSQRCSGSATGVDATALDGAVLDALRKTGSYRIRGDTLELMGEDGVLARFDGEG